MRVSDVGLSGVDTLEDLLFARVVFSDFHLGRFKFHGKTNSQAVRVQLYCFCGLHVNGNHYMEKRNIRIHQCFGVSIVIHL